MHDTFYFNANTLLRTHTSPVQVRTMESNAARSGFHLFRGRVYSLATRIRLTHHVPPGRRPVGSMRREL